MNPHPMTHARNAIDERDTMTTTPTGTTPGARRPEGGTR